MGVGVGWSKKIFVQGRVTNKEEEVKKKIPSE